MKVIFYVKLKQTKLQWKFPQLLMAFSKQLLFKKMKSLKLVLNLE